MAGRFAQTGTVRCDSGKDGHAQSDSGCCWLNELPGSMTMRDATCPLFVGALTQKESVRAWICSAFVVTRVREPAPYATPLVSLRPLPATRRPGSCCIELAGQMLGTPSIASCQVSTG